MSAHATATACAMPRYLSDRLPVIRELYALRNRIYNNFQSRVKFIQLAYRHDLVEAITRYELWDAGWEGLGERQFDTCFESGDSQDVIAELIKDARLKGYMANIERALGCPSEIARWNSYADRQSAFNF
jgi:hypothetical protein